MEILPPKTVKNEAFERFSRAVEVVPKMCFPKKLRKHVGYCMDKLDCS
jgi:hypothetical protein